MPERRWGRFASRASMGALQIRPMNEAEAVFPFYIVHQTLIVVFGYASLRMGLGNAAALVLILAGTVAGCWLFYLVGRTIGPLRPLIGLRRRQGGAGQVGVASEA